MTRTFVPSKQTPRARAYVQTNTGVVFVPPNDCSPHYLPAVCGGVQERVSIKRQQPHARSPSSWMSLCESEKNKSHDPVLCILLSHESAHALLSTHIITAVMELFCLLPLWLFSHPLLLFSLLFILFPFVFVMLTSAFFFFLSSSLLYSSYPSHVVLISVPHPTLVMSF